MRDVFNLTVKSKISYQVNISFDRFESPLYQPTLLRDLDLPSHYALGTRLRAKGIRTPNFTSNLGYSTKLASRCASGEPDEFV